MRNENLQKNENQISEEFHNLSEEQIQLKKIVHISNKEDRDFLLIYKTIDVNKITPVRIAGINIYNVERDEALAVTLLSLEKKEFQITLFLDPIKFMYLFNNPPTSISPMNMTNFIEGAGLSWAINKFYKPVKERVPVISYMMDLIHLANKLDLTIFLLGGKTKTLERTIFNLNRSFPGIRIIGRHTGFFAKGREVKVKEAIRKSSPDIIFIGMSFPYELQWVIKNQEYFPNSYIVCVGGSLDVLSGKYNKAPDVFYLHGLSWLWRMISRPWKIYKLYYTLKYFLLITYLRLNKKSRLHQI